MFFAKMKRKNELKDTRSNISPLLRIFEHQGENCFSGLLLPPFGELGLTGDAKNEIIGPSGPPPSYAL